MYTCIPTVIQACLNDCRNTCNIAIMKTLSILSRKGGVGKTTLALHLAVCASHKRKETVLLDLDPQASASDWGDSREADEPVIMSCQSARLQQTLEKAAEHAAELAIIDTAPHAEAASLTAARLSDLVLIPCKPAILDIRAIGHTIDIIQLAKVDAVVVLNTVPPKGSIIEETRDAIEGLGIEVCPVMVGQRVAFSHSLITGNTAQEYQSKGKAASEITQLYRWIMKRLS